MERPPPSAAPPRPVYCGVALHPQLTVPVVSTSPDPAEIYPAQALYPRFLSSSECISLSPSNGDLWRTSLPVQWLRICLQCKRPGFSPWVGNDGIPWRRERLPTPVFWPREFCGLYRPQSCKKLDMTEQLSHHI